MANSKNREKILKLTQASMIIAILIVLQISNLGFILIPPVSITIMHIPVIVGAIIMGPFYGAFFGGAMGVLALLNATFRGASPIDIAFSPFYSGSPVSSIFMSVVVRILIGLVAGLVFKALTKYKVNVIISAVIAAIVATLTNTLGVMSCLWLLFPKFGFSFKAIIQTIFAVNFLLEASAAAIFALAFAKALPALNKYIIKK